MGEVWEGCESEERGQGGKCEESKLTQDRTQDCRNCQTCVVSLLSAVSLPLFFLIPFPFSSLLVLLQPGIKSSLSLRSDGGPALGHGVTLLLTIKAHYFCGISLVFFPPFPPFITLFFLLLFLLLSLILPFSFSIIVEMCGSVGRLVLIPIQSLIKAST